MLPRMADLEQDLAVVPLLRRGIRERWRAKLTRGTAAARRKILNVLYHGPVIDERYAGRLPGDITLEGIVQELRERGASETCYVISNDSDLDGQTMKLEEVLPEVFGSHLASILSCIPGILAYYEGEEYGERYILHRPTRTH